MADDLTADDILELVRLTPPRKRAALVARLEGVAGIRPADPVREHLRAAGRKGGLARKASISKRKASAIGRKAGKASAEARRAKAEKPPASE